MRAKLIGLILVFFIVFTGISYAAVPVYQVTGKVVDSQSNNVSNASVSFSDNAGKPVASGTTGQDGSYLIVVPQGTYSVVAKAPSGINAPDISHKGQIISGNTSLNFTLNTPIPSKTPVVAPQKISLNLLVVVLMLILVAGATGFYLLKNRKSDMTSPPTPTGML